MSKESAQAFAQRMKSDFEFARTVRECRTLDDVQAFVQKSGFDFTRHEFNSLGGELADDELDQVTGGKIKPSEIDRP